MKKYYAGIGSRKTPAHILEKMQSIASTLSEHDWILSSGGADGADTAFSEGAQEERIFTGGQHHPLWTRAFTYMFHPKPNALSDYAERLMHRNAMIILGEDGDTSVDFVICWTDNGHQKGGTAQAMRIAKFFNIPIFNLYYDSDLKYFGE